MLAVKVPKLEVCCDLMQIFTIFLSSSTKFWKCAYKNKNFEPSLRKLTKFEISSKTTINLHLSKTNFCHKHSSNLWKILSKNQIRSFVGGFGSRNSEPFRAENCGVLSVLIQVLKMIYNLVFYEFDLWGVIYGFQNLQNPQNFSFCKSS